MNATAVPAVNVHAIRAIYRFEMARTFRTITQSIASPVLSTSLYFVVFGAAIGSRMGEVGGVSYGAFIILGLIMLSLLNESISNASFGIYMPKWAGTIFELLSAPVSSVEAIIGYVGAAATKSVMLGILILVTARLFVPYHIEHPVWMAAFLVLTAVTFSLFGFIIGLWADDGRAVIEIGLYRERAAKAASQRTLEMLAALRRPVTAAFRRHAALKAAPAGRAKIMPAPIAARLTPREREVAELLLRGCSSDAVALRLSISRHTVKDHRKHIFARLGISSLAELFALAA